MPDPDVTAGPLHDLDDRFAPWADDLWDPDVALSWNPPGSLDDDGAPGRTLHQVPQSGWYTIAAARRGLGDRAVATVEALLALQYDEPGTPWHGTFARFLEWPSPGADAVEWDDYDPNWRQFVGIAVTLLARHHPDVVDAALRQRIEDAVDVAVTGEQASGRLHWHYTNIALQHAWLLVEAGRVEEGEELAGGVVLRWRRRQTFPEFNSPTYDGVDLWALALWRGQSSSARLRTWGAELEAGLWRTLASRWHAGLGNVAGPYGRAYGLDLRRYVGKVGILAAAVAGTDGAPLPVHRPPAPDLAVAHGHDLLALPGLALAPPAIPDDAAAHLAAFTGERVVHDTITEHPTRRDASAWLADDVMIGAEDGDSDWLGWYQYVAGTVHWRRADGSIGVLRYVPDGPPRGRVEPGVLRIGGPGRLEVHEPEPPGVLHATKATASDAWVHLLDPGRTELDGLTVTLTPDGDGFVVEIDPG